jgi:hypothetical protein
VIEDGLTGFVVEDIEGAIDAVHRLDQLDRVRIRMRFEQRFTARRMADDYLSVYGLPARILELPRTPSALVNGSEQPKLGMEEDSRGSVTAA